MLWQPLFRSGSPNNVLVGLARTRIRIGMLNQALDEIGERIPHTVELQWGNHLTRTSVAASRSPLIATSS